MSSPRSTSVPSLPDTVPTTVPPVVLPVEPTTVPPIELTTVPPIEPTTVPPVEPIAVPPVEPTTVPPVEPTVVPPVEPTTVPPIVPPVIIQIIDGSGYVIQNTQFTDASGNQNTETTFTTIDASSDVQITEDLRSIVGTYYDNSTDSSANAVLNQIKFYASEISCSQFQGKGTIEDYTEIFDAASRIANESKQIQLDVDIEGFNEFADAADQLSKLFTSFIVKLQNVSIIDDLAFLTSVSIALEKIWNLSKVFGKFKETILATSTIELPKSTHDTRVVLEGVVSNVNCAMKYVSHFVDASFSAPPNADLSDEEKGILKSAVQTIDNWNVLCEQGVTIAMANNPDIQYIKQASAQLKNTTQTLVSATNQLKSKLSKIKVY